MSGLGLMGNPFDTQTVGQAAENGQNTHAVCVAHPAEIIVVGNIQPLMEPVFDSPVGAIEPQPALGLEAFWGSTGEQGDRFGFVPLDLPSQARHLCGRRKTDLLRMGWGSLNDADFIAAFISLLATGLSAGGVRRGEKLPEVPAVVSQCFGPGLVDFL